uniref:Uncharacterized protein n=1 Tax=Rhizophora mucronata TaxID=61149 RepID=A0A2P2Q7X4_RHIMU
MFKLDRQLDNQLGTLGHYADHPATGCYTHKDDISLIC